MYKKLKNPVSYKNINILLIKKNLSKNIKISLKNTKKSLQNTKKSFKK